ncbi:MAG: TonB-dependent receptor [Bacteroidales bacterium]|jgi:TonB-linked SusC/RagA family outer membrane protein|nr:TonB-dependent receptor [Bacteroidales bacterium]
MKSKFGYLKYRMMRISLFLFLGLCWTNMPANALSDGQSVQPSHTVRGNVSDNNGELLPGVNVVIRGTVQGTITDAFGEFSINVPDDTTVLQFSFVGYQMQEVVVGARRVIAVTLNEEAAEIGEVTIVAFGKQKKESVIASIESVRMSDLKQPSSNLTSAFAGKIPGLISYQTTGEPGEDLAQFFVRGVTTFGYTASPLILIDGFEASATDLARIQPDDVESFSVLRDASATVLYGARGANGIILVNTKAGREGPVKLNARVDVHVATPTRVPEMLGAVDYMKLYNQARMSRNPGLGAYYSEQKIYSTMAGENPMIYPNINWYEALFKNYTINTKANVNVSGGGQVANYYVSGGYDNETGLLKVNGRNNFNNNINIDRFHIRTNVLFKLTSTTSLDTRIQGRFENYTGPYVSTSTLFNEVMNANPVDFPTVYEPDEGHRYVEHVLFGSQYSGSSPATNPYAEMVRGYEERNETTINAQVTLMQDLKMITEGLKVQAKASAKVRSRYSSRRTFLPYYYTVDTYNPIAEEYTLMCLNPTSGRAYLGNVEPGRDADGLYYFEGRLNWDRQFGKHSVGFMTVAMATSVQAQLADLSNLTIYEALPERNLGNSSRITYNYDSRYFLELAYGYNGSEKFTGKKQFGFFPSIGGGWLVSNEDFFASHKDVISNLKLKFTWGLVGNDAISTRAQRFFFLSDITKGGSSFTWGESFNHSEGGYTINRYANPDITWEVSEKYNAGLEISFFKDEALKLQVDVFRDFRDQIYLNRETIPATAGFERDVRGNVGKAISRGLDGSLDYQYNFNKDLWVTGRANFTYSTNEYIELDETDYEDKYLKHTGHNINQQWGYVAERLFVDETEIKNAPEQTFGGYDKGDIRYRDVNDDGVVDPKDRIAMGYPTVPEIQYGFGMSAGYKNFDFSFFFQGNARVSFFINSGVGGGTESNEGIAPFVNRRNALTIVARDAWSEDNQNVHAFWPRLTDQVIANNNQQSSWWMRNGSFLRLKSTELGYNLNGWKALRFIGAQSGRIYFSAENPFVFSPFKLWDPEMGRKGLAYPLNRRFNVGVQVNF